MVFKLIAVLGLALCALVNGHAVSEQKVVRFYGKLGHIGEKMPEHHEEYAWAYPAYEFSYKVNDPHTHDMKGQEESRDGDVVKGMYWLIQPDGRKRTVTYHSNKHDGFQAHVEYSDPHHEPEKHEHEKHKVKVEHIIEHKHEEHVHKHEEPIHEYKHEEPIHEYKHEEPKHEYKPHFPHINYKPHLEEVVLKWDSHREHHHVPKLESHNERHEHEPYYGHRAYHHVPQHKPIYVPDHEPTHVPHHEPLHEHRPHYKPHYEPYQHHHKTIENYRRH